jgi:hypothetical protein
MNEELVTVPAVLPPFLYDRLEDEGRIDPNVEQGDIDVCESQIRLIKDEPYRARIWAITATIWPYLGLPGPDWGPWPDKVEDCLAIAANLSALIFGELDESLCRWPEEVIEDLERDCRERCISLEVLLINRLFDMKSDPLE